MLEQAKPSTWECDTQEYFRTSYQSPVSWFALQARRDGLVSVQLGNGSVAAVHDLLTAWEHIWATLPIDRPVTIVADMRDAKTASLRVQYMIGCWLVGHSDRIRKVAVYGTGALQTRIVQTAMAIARISRVKFFLAECDALGWAVE